MLYDVIIIGGGPAGITAGIYAVRKKLNTLLITKDFVGQVGKIALIENYPGFSQISGLELMENLKNQLKKFEIEAKEGEEVRELKKEGEIFEVLTSKGNSFQAKTVIVATGRNPRPLQVPGETELVGRGVSYCSLCDAPFFKDKVVAVIGGGNAGFEAALDLTKYSPKIYLLEAAPKVRADEITQERVRKTGKVEIITNAQTKEIKGNDFVEGLVYQDRGTGQSKELKVEGIFIEIGSIPATAFLKDLVEFNQFGEIKIDPQNCETKIPGLFAAGDVTDVKYKQIVVAAGEGTKAALAAHEHLQKLNIKNQNAK